MFVIPEPTPAEPALPPDFQIEDREHQRDLFLSFLATGMDLARRIQVKATEAGPTPADALAFERVGRAIRRTVILIHKLDNPGRKSPTPKPKPPTAEPIASPDREPSEAERDERGEEIGNRPIPEIIASIRRDLALATQSHPAPPKNEAPPAQHSQAEAIVPLPPPSSDRETAQGQGESTSMPPLPPLQQGRNEGVAPAPTPKPKHPPDG